jgi:UDP-galactopyranose mutase
MYRKRSTLNDWQRILIWVLVGFILVAGSIATYRYATRVISPLPQNIQSELSFSPFIIEDSKKYSSESYKFSKVENNTQIFSYLIHIKDGTTISLSEYTQPPQFTEISEYKDRFLTNVAKQYATVPTSNGTIYLGRMEKQNNKQLAVMIEKGLLVFMAPDQEMNEAQWRALGDKLKLLTID